MFTDQFVVSNLMRTKISFFLDQTPITQNLKDALVPFLSAVVKLYPFRKYNLACLAIQTEFTD